MNLLGVGVDIGGSSALQPWIEAAGCTFNHAVDSEGLCTRVFGFNFIPSVFLIDEAGALVGRHILFWIERPEHRTLLDRFIAGELQPLDTVTYDDTVPNLPAMPAHLDGVQQTHFDQVVADGVRLKDEGRIDEAAAAWRRALDLDPMNFILRSQVWMLLYPDKFHPTVDYVWQDQQMQVELAEIEGLVCGPDGCWVAPESHQAAGDDAIGRAP